MAIDAGEERLLLEFLNGRDACCPACGYNLRDLRTPVCPECREPLRLQVGCQRARFGLFVLTVAPCIFSGIAAVLMLIPIVLDGGPPLTGFLLVQAFGLSSGVFGLVLLAMRERFIRARHRRQVAWAAAIWSVHLAAFAMLLLWGIYFS